MYGTILTIHSVWAVVALILVAVAIVVSFMGWSGNKEFTLGNKKIALFGLISAHIQFVIGLILYFTSPNGIDKIKALGMGGLSAYDRLLAVEHPMVNLIAIVLITIGYSKHKKAIGLSQHKNIAIFYSIAAVLLLSRIPWDNWLA
ncbi:MAG: hypothetical protein IR153_05805 [Flavobacterium sp.]|nr:hypothetical protein [Flavobacterium sp.]